MSTSTKKPTLYEKEHSGRCCTLFAGRLADCTLLLLLDLVPLLTADTVRLLILCEMFSEICNNLTRIEQSHHRGSGLDYGASKGHQPLTWRPRV